jgi:Holliday junction resolvase-like predicted endonuclease
MSTSQVGAAFESYVASIYEGLGCKVERNVLISGQQVDLLVRRNFPGMGTIISIVECKYLTNAAVSNQDIYNFNHFFLSCREHNRIK